MAADLIDRILERAGQAAADRPLPEATYRFQLYGGFTFRDATELLPYLHELGITHCYTSPYLKARPGSLHGYDIVDHRAFNPEIGTDADHEAFVSALRARGMGHVLDIVPNHMGIGKENPWWTDVLENGPASPFASYFDIAWYDSPRPQLQGRVLLPVLGEPYGRALESGLLRAEFADGAFRLAYLDHRFPIDTRTYGILLAPMLEELARRIEPVAPSLLEAQSILTAVKHLPERWQIEPEHIAEAQREKEVIKRRLGTLVADSPAAWESLALTLSAINDPTSADWLDQLLGAQAYRLSHWRVAAEEINYRRFFDINDLAALSMERDDVFTATHSLILRLLSEGKVTGVRIDHPDGLYDPQDYLHRLQREYVVEMARRKHEVDAEAGKPPWEAIEPAIRARLEQRLAAAADRSLWRPLNIVVEKILGAGEDLPTDWPVAGTTGYEVANAINGLFVDSSNADRFTAIYEDWIDDDTPFAEVVYHKKIEILQTALSSELYMLAHQLDRLAQKELWSRDFTFNGLRRALREVVASFPVYRTYISSRGVSDTDRRRVLLAVRRAKRRTPVLSAALYDFVRDTVLGEGEWANEKDAARRAEQLRFAGKFQQVTAPVVAKGVEDSAFYVFNRLVSLNEVGGDPARFGIVPEALHRYFRERRERQPWGLSATSTHDTKRSEDVRARLNVLSEIPDEWRDHLATWRRLNGPCHREIDELSVPDPNEEYLLYQSLIGTWPLESPRGEAYRHYVERVQDYMNKAIHEAKVHSSWINPDNAHDEAVRRFVADILDPVKSREFLDDFLRFQARISRYGLFNSLSQTLLKIAGPGVPDMYQGTEVWDFSLVDPDNRRPVDYDRRRTLLRELRSRVRDAGPRMRDLAAEVATTPGDGRIKLYITWRALTCRREHPRLFAEGAYLPIDVSGHRREHVFAFQRRLDTARALVIVPRLLTRLIPAPDAMPIGRGIWGDTALNLPEQSPARVWRNVFTGETVSSSDTLAMADALSVFPVAVLIATE
jgi:(1->4)-alpha-D-glucan 1-alpha-D-glucosylmutase